MTVAYALPTLGHYAELGFQLEEAGATLSEKAFNLVSEFVDTEQTFTAWDVTRYLRGLFPDFYIGHYPKQGAGEGVLAEVRSYMDGMVNGGIYKVETAEVAPDVYAQLYSPVRLELEDLDDDDDDDDETTKDVGYSFATDLQRQIEELRQSFGRSFAASPTSVSSPPVVNNVLKFSDYVQRDSRGRFRGYRPLVQE